MNHFSQSIQLVKGTYSLIWRNQKVLWYGFLLVLVPMLLDVITPFVLSFKEAIRWSDSFLTVIIIIALFNYIYALMGRKRITFVQSFSFSPDLVWKGAIWALILSLIRIGLEYSVLESGLQFSGVPFYVHIDYMRFGIWLTRWFAVGLISLGIFFFLAILVKKNRGFVQTLKDSFIFVWENLFVTIVALLTSFIWNIGLVLALFSLVVALTWLIGLIFSIGLGFKWLTILGSIAAIPGAYLIFYIVVVWTILPAVLYNQLSKSR